MIEKGKVYLVGAGPGDPELITLKGWKLLTACDVVVYDRLAPSELVAILPQHIERRFVGKASGQHSLPQEEINELLKELALQDKAVVRLKGGDPFIFGRGAEEALFLRQAGIPFQIVPGITAGIAAAAYAGIPPTYRKMAVFTLFLTAHEAAEKDEAQLPWDWLAQARQGTIVGYMGVKQLSNVVRKLLSGGMRPETPAALIERGTTGLQRTVITDLKHLPEAASQAQVKPPALFVLGEVVTLAEDLKWVVPLPLHGRRVMVTRASDQAEEICELLRAQGAEILLLPTIATAEVVETEVWDDLKVLFDRRHLRLASEPLHWLVFSSENGVRYFFKQLRDHNFDQRALAAFRIAALGAGTDAELEQIGLRADFVPQQATAETLVEELLPQLQDQTGLVLRVRGNLGDDLIERKLKSAGVEVIPLQVYRTFNPTWDESQQALLGEQPPDVITFTSGSTVQGFIANCGAEEARGIAAAACVASIGPVTSQIARSVGFQIDVEAAMHTAPGLVAAIVAYFQDQKP